MSDGSEHEETGDADSEGGKLPPALRADPDAKTYIYRDFANLPENPSDSSPQVKRGNSEVSIRVQKFPVKVLFNSIFIVFLRGAAALMPVWRQNILLPNQPNSSLLNSSMQFYRKQNLVTLSLGYLMGGRGKFSSPISLKHL
jgi:hypothetical protein